MSCRPGTKSYYLHPELKMYFTIDPRITCDLSAYWKLMGVGGASHLTEFDYIFIILITCTSK